MSEKDLETKKLRVYLKGSVGTELIRSHQISFQPTNLLARVNLDEIVGSSNGSEETEIRTVKY